MYSVGCENLMDADKIEDLARMYNLLKRVDSLDQLQLHFGFYIKASLEFAVIGRVRT